MSKIPLPTYRRTFGGTTMLGVTGGTITCANPSLRERLDAMKSRIDGCPSEWDATKRLTNPYEYLHSPAPTTRTPVAKKTPASRAYFKMVEILGILGHEHVAEPLSSFHLAEGPGGFIEALVESRPHHEDADRHYGITLLRDETGIPGWKKGRNFLQAHASRVTVLGGADGTGDILNIATYEQYKHRFGGTMDLVTGDGGVDFSANYAEQERTAFPLILAEACYAVMLQKPGGTLVLKLFDTVLSSTRSLIYSLSQLYTSVCIVKPYTSRPANSERYLVCREFVSNALAVANSAKTLRSIISGEVVHVGGKMDAAFDAALTEATCILGQRQLENMSATFELIASRKKNQEDRIVEANITACVKWCRDHHIGYTQREKVNVFLATGRTDAY